MSHRDRHKRSRTSLFVRNIPKGCRSADFDEAFKEYGEVSDKIENSPLDFNCWLVSCFRFAMFISRLTVRLLHVCFKIF